MATFQRIAIELSDGYQAQAAVFRPDGADSTRRAALCLHGIQSHCGWFLRSASALAQAGRAVLLPDRRGSGACGRDRGHAASVGQLLDDGRRYLQRAQAVGGGRPVHLLGVSWGGRWALALAAANPDRVASLVLSTPGLYARRSIGPLRRLAVGLCAALWPGKRFDIPLNDPRLFTDVAEHVRFIASDPLRLRRATGRFLFVSHLMERRQRHWAAAVRCPVLLLLAEGDPIIDNDRTLSLLQGGLPPHLLTVKRFGGAVHTLEFQADPAAYLRTLIEWTDRHDRAPP